MISPYCFTPNSSSSWPKIVLHGITHGFEGIEIVMALPWMAQFTVTPWDSSVPVGLEGSMKIPVSDCILAHIASASAAFSG
jgi:hypothetical protein